MRNLRIIEHLSLDGIIAPGGPHEGTAFANGGWSAPYRTPAGAEAVARAHGERYDLLLGRRTYDQWASIWPTITGGPFADRLNAATKYVVTHRPDSLTWGPIGYLGADVSESVRRIKADDGPDLLVCGSSTLTAGLLEQGLVDELVLIVYPILLGTGKRIFSDEAAPREFTLVNTLATPTGVVVNTYKHVGPLQTA